MRVAEHVLSLTLDFSRSPGGQYWPGLSKPEYSSAHGAFHTLPTPPSELKPAFGLSRDQDANVAAAVAHPLQMLTGAEPPSLTARRSAASGLPNFELPPPPLSNYRFSSINATQPSPAPTSLASVGNLLTPPSANSNDNVSPLSSGLNSNGTAQSVPPFTPTGFWQPPPQAAHPYYSMQNPHSFIPPRGMFSPTQHMPLARNNTTSSASTDQLPQPPYELSLPPSPIRCPCLPLQPSRTCLNSRCRPRPVKP